MKTSVKNFSLQYLFLLILVITIASCTKKIERPVDCVQEFIIAAREHDIPKAWALLGPEAASFYNDIGEKNRKSGKGILEHDISEVTKFKPPDGGYKIIPDVNNSLLIIIETSNNERVNINVVDSDGEYKIKDAQSVRNLIRAIAAEIVEKEYY